MAPAPVHFFHMHVGHGHVPSRWEVPAQEHFTALRDAEFRGRVCVGLVGDEENRLTARLWLDKTWPRWQPAVVADDGYEQWTLAAMHRWAKAADPQTPVYYAHTKGAYQDHPFNHNWRRGMEALLMGTSAIHTWRDRVGDLASGKWDAVGLHWLTPDDFPVTISVGRPMFAGNFWWATAGYLATLPEVEGGNPMLGYNRFKAEEWLGQLQPRVLDLKPGWPEYEDTGGYNSITGGRLHA